MFSLLNHVIEVNTCRCGQGLVSTLSDKSIVAIMMAFFCAMAQASAKDFA
jgi:hypothetical protein